MTDEIIEDNAAPAPRPHVDDLILDRRMPLCVRWFLYVHRTPAVDQILLDEALPGRYAHPRLFADYQGDRVRVVMASRLGDVGITWDHTKEHGYTRRVTMDELSNFGDAPDKVGDLRYVSDYADVMTLEEFDDAPFIPDDGHGNLVKMVDGRAMEKYDSDVFGPDDLREGFTHVAWYNK